jgi:hypothetical protein
MQRNAMKIKLVVASILFGLATSLHAAPPPPIPAKPAAEWLDELRRDTAAEQPDAALERLRWGAVMHMYKRWTPKGEQVQAWNEFEAFWKERGKALLAKINAGQELTEDEQKYEWIVRGIHISRGSRNSQLPNSYMIFGYCPLPKNLVERAAFTTIYRGRMILKKGYSGLPLTADDIAGLREYNIWLCNRHGHAEHLPFYFGLTRATHRRPGESFPNFYIKRFDTVVNDPTYSDYGGDVWGWTERLKPIGIERLLTSIDGYNAHKDNFGRYVCTPKSADDGWAREEDGFVRLSSFRGKKPVVLIVSDIKDVFARRWFPALEPVYQAYKDRVQFFIVNTAFDDWWSQKTAFGVQIDSFYGDYATSARLAKHFYMHHPNVSVPCLLDDQAASLRNAVATSGGGGQFVILDTDGKVSYESPHGRKYGSDCHDEVWWLNDLETELQAVLTNGGKCDPKRGWDDMNEVRTEMARLMKEGKIMINGQPRNWFPYKKWPSGRHTKPVWVFGEIRELDQKTGRITVRVLLDRKGMLGYGFNRRAGDKAELSAWGQKNMEVVARWVEGTDEDRTYVFAVDKTVELFLNGKPAALADFRVGDRVGARYGYLPDMLKDPENPDSKNFTPTAITRLQDGSTLVTPEHIRVMRLP